MAQLLMLLHSRFDLTTSQVSLAQAEIEQLYQQLYTLQLSDGALDPSASSTLDELTHLMKEFGVDGNKTSSADKGDILLQMRDILAEEVPVLATRVNMTSDQISKLQNDWNQLTADIGNDTDENKMAETNGNFQADNSNQNGESQPGTSSEKVSEVQDWDIWSMLEPAIGRLEDITPQVLEYLSDDHSPHIKQELLQLLHGVLQTSSSGPVDRGSNPQNMTFPGSEDQGSNSQKTLSSGSGDAEHSLQNLESIAPNLTELPTLVSSQQPNASTLGQIMPPQKNVLMNRIEGALHHFMSEHGIRLGLNSEDLARLQQAVANLVGESITAQRNSTRYQVASGDVIDDIIADDVVQLVDTAALAFVHSVPDHK